MPIGSKDEAAEILACRSSNFGACNWTIPDDWEYVGSGEYRAVFLSPTGVVYKIETRQNSRQSNRGEYERILELRYSDAVKATGVIIPKAWLYTIGRVDVIAMEFISGEHVDEFCDSDCYCDEYYGKECAWNQLERIGYLLKLQDLHGENALFIPEQRKWAVIDFGA